MLTMAIPDVQMLAATFARNMILINSSDGTVECAYVNVATVGILFCLATSIGLCQYITPYFCALSFKSVFLWNNVGPPRPPPRHQRYWLIQKNMDWQSAVNYCYSMNTGLVAITNADEQEGMRRYLSRKDGKFVCCVQGSGDSMNQGPKILRIWSGEKKQLYCPNF